MIGIGIIGAGNIFRTHAGAYEYFADRIRLVAVAETDREKRDYAAGRYFIPAAYADYRDLLDRHDVDVVDICSPPFCHEEMVINALKAGKVVLCEKPLTTSMAAADRIMDVARRFPGKLSTIYQHRYDPEFRKLLWLKEKGYLGKLLTGHVLRLANLRNSQAYKSGWWGKWDVAGGGVVMTQMIHHLDQLNCLFGKPVEVYAAANTLCLDIESEDTFAATLRYESGAEVSCNSSVAASSVMTRMDVIGERATVRIPWSLKFGENGQAAQIEDELKTKFPPLETSRGSEFLGRVKAKINRKLGGYDVYRPVNTSNYHAWYLESVFDAMESQQPLPIGPDEARLSLEVCMGIYESAITGQPTSLPLCENAAVYQGVTSDAYKQRYGR